MDADKITEPHLLRFTYQRTYGEDTTLNKYARNVYSQNGEDGIIERIFALLGTGGKFCVEFGAADGKLYSNTLNLVENGGWNGLMIESDPELYEKLEETAAMMSGRLAIANGFVGVGKYPPLSSYLKDCPDNPDLLSIDVDGMDYHIWEAMETPRARVVVIEHCPTVPVDVIFCQAKNEELIEGASAAALVELGRRKGYSLAAVTWCNVIFVEDGEFFKLGIEDNSLEILWRRPFRERFFQTQSGKIYTIGLDRDVWRPNNKIHPDSLQLYDESRK